MRIVSLSWVSGVCEACGAEIEFTLFEDANTAFYDADEIVNKWMDHQLSDCKPSVIDNPGIIS